MPMWLAGPHAGDGSEIQQDGDQRDKEEKGQIKGGEGRRARRSPKSPEMLFSTYLSLKHLQWHKHIWPAAAAVIKNHE